MAGTAAKRDMRAMTDDQLFDELMALVASCKKTMVPKIERMMKLQRMQTIRGIADYAESMRSSQYRLDDIICMKFNVVTRKKARKKGSNR